MGLENYNLNYVLLLTFILTALMMTGSINAEEAVPIISNFVQLPWKYILLALVGLSTFILVTKHLARNPRLYVSGAKALPRLYRPTNPVQPPVPPPKPSQPYVQQDALKEQTKTDLFDDFMNQIEKNKT